MFLFYVCTIFPLLLHFEQSSDEYQTSSGYMEINSHEAARVKYVRGVLDTFRILRKNYLLCHFVQSIYLTKTLFKGCQPNPPIKAYTLTSTRCK